MLVGRLTIHVADLGAGEIAVLYREKDEAVIIVARRMSEADRREAVRGMLRHL